MGIATTCMVASGQHLDWWQWLVLLLAAFDVFGGVAANASRAAAPDRAATGSPWRPVAFAACHVHPIVLAMLLPGVHPAAGIALWLVSIVGAVATHLAGPALRVPSALAFCALAVSPFAVAPGLSGAEWLAPALLLKLVAAPAAASPRPCLFREALP